MHLFFRRYLRDIITALFLIVVGILLLINPVAFAMGLVKLAGVFLVVLGALRIVRYFRTDPETAARGQDFFIGLIAILGGSSTACSSCFSASARCSARSISSVWSSASGTFRLAVL